MPKSPALLKRISDKPLKARCCSKRQNNKLGLLLLFLLAYQQATAEMLTTDDPALLSIAEQSEFGWVHKDQLPEALKGYVPAGCHGVYIESITDKQNLPIDEALNEIDIVLEADSAEVTDGDKAILQGNVVVSQGSRSITAGRMSYERAEDKATLEDGVTIRQAGMRIDGSYADVSTADNKAEFSDASFVLKEQQIRGGASSVKQLSATELELNNGYITSCEPGDNSWVLEGEKLTVNRKTQQGTGKHVKLKIGSVPVFYLPYITFPVGDQRQTGFLFPSLSSSDDGGLDIALPYYWNLAPNYDATLSPRFITGRGTMLELEGRYLNRWMRTQSGLAFLPDDGGGQDPDVDALIEQGQISEQVARPNKGKNRWLAQLQQTGGGTSGWYTRAEYTRVSDEDYFRDLGTSSLSVASNTFLEQSLELGYQFDHWRISSLAQAHQVLLLDINTPYRKLPQIDINGRYNVDDWTVVLNNRYTQFKHRDNQPNILTGSRFNTDYRLRWEKRYPWAFLVPEVGFKSLHYSLDENPLLSIREEEQFNLSAPQASIDFGLVFEHSPGTFTQTLEPRLFYLFRDYEDHSALFDLGVDNNLDINFDTTQRTFSYGQLYRDSRFIGGDRLDDANQITLGLTSRWQYNDTGRDLFSVSAGQILHFKDRLVSLAGNLNEKQTESASEFASEFKVNVGRYTQLYGNAIYDRESSKVNRGSAGVNFASSDYQKLFNISYSFLRDATSIPGVQSSRDIDQVDTSFALPVNQQWSVMGRANYDFQNKQELETFVGLEYNDCCYRFRILARRWLDSNIANLVADQDAQYDQGIFFEIHFKGLGGSGAKANTILNDGIFGYETREKLLH